MRITLYIGSLAMGGTERVVCGLANHFAQQGHHVDILTMSEIRDVSFQLLPQVTHTILLKETEKTGFWGDQFRRWKRFRSYIRETPVNCYIVMLPVTTILLLAFRRSITVPIIASERENPSMRSSRMYTFLLRLLASQADRFVFQTSEVRKWYGKCVDDTKAIIIPNAVSESFLRPHYKGNRQPFIFGIGRLIASKRFDLLIQAFSLIACDFPEYKLVIFGDGNERASLEKKVAALHLTERIYLPGCVQNVAHIMEQGSLFVLSSDFEGMPNTLIEAMALGLPCIATSCGEGVTSLIHHEENGVIIPVGDEEALVSAMRNLLLSPEKREKLGEKAWEIRNRLAPDVVFSMWDQVVEEVVRDYKNERGAIF